MIVCIRRVSPILDLIGTTLQCSSEQREECSELNIRFATKEITRPHYEQCAHSTASTEDTICSRDDWSCDRIISRLAFRREVEVSIPSWLTDSTGDD